MTIHPFLEKYEKVVIPKLKENFKYENKFTIPKVTKISVNAGIGDLAGNNGNIEAFTKTISMLTGQRPVVTKARKAISGFKIRINNPIGLKVTLRGKKMNDFILKLSEVSLMRVRDFRGLKPSSITKDGNLNIGIKDLSIFPDMPADFYNHPLQITIDSSAKTKEESTVFYNALGFVFQQNNDKK